MPSLDTPQPSLHLPPATATMHFFLPKPQPQPQPQPQRQPSGDATTITTATTNTNPIHALYSHCSALLHRFSSSFLHHNALRLAATPAHAAPSPAHRFDLAMKVEDVEERLAGIPVYALSNADEEFMLVSGASSGKSMGLLCFNKEDAEAMLDQVKRVNQGIHNGSKVVPVALNKVFQLKVNGVAFRFIPDSCQVVNAMKVMKQTGIPADDFPGVPVFQSQSLVLKSRKKRYRPVFFRKEDLDDSLAKTAREKNYVNPALRRGDIQVASLEEIISELKGPCSSRWDDVVFVPPGFDISGSVGQQQEKAVANA